MAQSMLYALGGTGFTFLMTSLGAAVVFFFRKEMKEEYQRVFLGFAAGVMIAASVWSLLIPAIDQAEEMGLIGWIPVSYTHLLLLSVKENPVFCNCDIIFYTGYE